MTPPGIESTTDLAISVVAGRIWFVLHLLDYEFLLLVLLASFVRPGIGPPHHRLAALAKDITNTVKPRDEKPIFSLPNSDIDALIKQIGTTWSSIKPKPAKIRQKTINL